jgi:hypothetical protein
MQHAQSVSRALARVQLPGARHFVQFYQLDDGNIAAYEEGSLNAGDQPVDASSWGHMTLSDIIQQLQPGSTVPAAVQAADQRRTARVRAYTASIPAQSRALVTFKEPAAGPLDEERGAQALRNAQPSGLLTTASVDPGTDATWWTQTFCSEKQMHSVWCPTNITWAHSGWRPTMYYEAAGMSASSVASADFWVEQWQSSGWVRIFSQVAGPRTWWKWWFNGEGTFRSGVDGRSPEPWVHFAERVRFAITTFESAGIYPDDVEWQFNNDIQGITHDDGNWFFTRTVYSWDPFNGAEPEYGVIAKAPVSFDLGHEPHEQIAEPDEWLKAGFNHFGALTRRGSLLYIALEGSSGCAIGVWDTDIRFYVGLGLVPGIKKCGWIAYNPRDNLFYMSENNWTLFRYDVAVSGNTVNVTPHSSIVLAMQITNVGGAEFSSLGNLYVFKGYKESPLQLFGVDPYNGFVYWRASWTGYGDEAEGLTIWDLTDGRAPHISGHLHVELLDNDTFDNDDMYIAHLRAVDPSRL